MSATVRAHMLEAWKWGAGGGGGVDVHVIGRKDNVRHVPAWLKLRFAVMDLVPDCARDAKVSVGLPKV
jgi:hypothetical protein